MTFRPQVLWPKDDPWPAYRTLSNHESGVNVFSQTPDVDPPGQRVLDILLAVADGCTNEEAAEKLGICSGTVKNKLRDVTWLLQQRGVMTRETGHCGRAGLIGAAFRLGWIS